MSDQGEKPESHSLKEANATRPWYKEKRWWLLIIMGCIILIFVAGGSGSTSTDEGGNGNSSNNEGLDIAVHTLLVDAAE